MGFVRNTFICDVATYTCPPAGGGGNITESDTYCIPIAEDKKICIGDDIIKICIKNNCVVV